MKNCLLKFTDGFLFLHCLALGVALSACAGEPHPPRYKILEHWEDYFGRDPF